MINDTSSVTKGDTFPSSSAGEGKGRCVLKFSNALTLREAATVFSAPSNRATKAFAAFTLCEVAMVLHAPSTPGYRNIYVSVGAPMRH